jgi:hypothetical protein
VRTLALLGGVAALALVLSMAVAGVGAATAVLVTGVALVGMIALGSTLGGRERR